MRFCFYIRLYSAKVLRPSRTFCPKTRTSCPAKRSVVRAPARAGLNGGPIDGGSHGADVTPRRSADHSSWTDSHDANPLREPSPCRGSKIYPPTRAGSPIRKHQWLPASAPTPSSTYGLSTALRFRACAPSALALLKRARSAGLRAPRFGYAHVRPLSRPGRIAAGSFFLAASASPGLF